MTRQIDIKNNNIESKSQANNNATPLSVFGLLFIYMNSFNNNSAISCTGYVRRPEGIVTPQLASPVDGYSFKS